MFGSSRFRFASPPRFRQAAGTGCGQPLRREPQSAGRSETAQGGSPHLKLLRAWWHALLLCRPWERQSARLAAGVMAPNSQIVGRSTTMATSRTSRRRASTEVSVWELSMTRPAQVPIQRIHREGTRQAPHVSQTDNVPHILCRSMTLAQLRKVLKNLGCS